MSFGALKLGNGTYQSLSLKIAKFQPADFENVPYLEASDLLIHGFGIPESAIPDLNRCIGRFLVAIQEASFVDSSVFDVVPTTDTQGRALNELPLDSRQHIYFYSTTLSAIALLTTIRENVAALVHDVLALSPESHLGLSEHDSTVKSSILQPRVQHRVLAFSSSGSHEGVFHGVNFLSDDARQLLDRCGPGVCVAVNQLLEIFAESVVARADLSFGSLVRDMRACRPLSDGSDSRVCYPTDAPYSTLNPSDFMAMAKRNLPNFPAGLIMRLPSRIRHLVVNRIQAKDQVSPAAL